MKEKVLRDTQIRNIHELGEIKRAQELRVDEFSGDNTEIHFAHVVYARTNEFYERFRGISGSGIELHWEIVSRSQSTKSDSKFSFHAEPQQMLAIWYMECTRVTGKRFR